VLLCLARRANRFPEALAPSLVANLIARKLLAASPPG
jgi:hypothetical protein